MRLTSNSWPGGVRGLNACHGFDIDLYNLTIQMGILSINGTVQSKFQKDNQKRH